MSVDESIILALFRQYKIGPEEMLFFNAGTCKLSGAPFRNAMQSLMNRGMVIKERPKEAYSLTRQGYTLSLNVEPATTSRRKAHA